MAALLGALAGVGPAYAQVQPPPEAPTERDEAIHGPPQPIQGPPPPPGLRLPGRLPRAEVVWDRGVRYRLLSGSRVTLDGSLPDVSLINEPLLDGRVGLKLHVDGAGFVERGDIEGIANRIEIRRAFLTTAGVVRLLYPVFYQFEFGALVETFYLDSAWLMIRDLRWVGSLKLGGLDAPIGFDNLVSSRDRLFMEVPAPVQAFVPATSLGLQARDTHHDGRGTWAFGWFTVGQRRDVGDQSRALARVVGRTTWLLHDPDVLPAPGWPELLHVGAAGAYTFAGGDEVRYQARPESFLAPTAVDTGNFDASQAFVAGLEVAGRHGPLSFQGEYLHAVADQASASFPGAYLAASYLVTGEVRPYDRESAVFGQVVPQAPLRPRRRTFGAAEVVARASWLDLDHGPIHGGRMVTFGTGLNWYWSRWIRWQASHEFSVIDGGPLDGRLHTFQARFQLVL